MNRWMSVAVVVSVCAAVGCSNGASDPSDTTPPGTQTGTPTATTFAGTWRSVTPSMEFVRLTVESKSSEQGALAARLTYSGVYWEGSGRIEGDALVASMAMSGAAAPTGVLTARASDAATLRVTMRPADGATTELTFVRDN